MTQTHAYSVQIFWELPILQMDSAACGYCRPPLHSDKEVNYLDSHILSITVFGVIVTILESIIVGIFFHLQETEFKRKTN